MIRTLSFICLQCKKPLSHLDDDLSGGKDVLLESRVMIPLQATIVESRK